MRFSPGRFLMVILCAALPVGLWAQTTWTGAGGNANVGTAGNWNNSIVPPNNGSATLTFPTPVTSTAVNFDSAYSVSSLSFTGSSAYSVAGSGGGTALSIGTGGITSSATASVTISNSLTLTSGAKFETGTSNLTVNAVNNGGFNLELKATGGALTLTGALTGNGALTVTGSNPGVVFLTSTGNTYAGGTTINSGVTLQIGDAGGTTPGSLPGSVTNNGTLNFKPGINNSANYTYNGIISGSGNLLKLGTGSTLTLGGGNTYSGTTNVAEGTLVVNTVNALPVGTALSVGSAGTLANSGVLNVANSQTVDHFGSSGSNSTITIQSGQIFTLAAGTGGSSSSYSGIINGGGQLTINGVSSSKVTLTGSGTFTGGTSVQSGQLTIKNTPLGSGAVSVASGATLAGDTNGTFTGPLTLSGTVRAIGTFSTGAVTVNGDSKYSWVISDANGTAGGMLGLLSITGSLNLTGLSAAHPFTIAPFSGVNNTGAGLAANFDTTQSYSFTIATTTTGITGFNAANFAFDFTNFSNAYTGTWSIGTANSGNNLILNYTGGAAIPEPAVSGFLAGVAACGLAVWRRRSRLAGKN